MITHRDYMRRWQRRRRWPHNLAQTLAKLERLILERPEGAELPPLPDAVRAAWRVERHPTPTSD